MIEKASSNIHPIRKMVAEALSWVEDVVYVGLGLMLSVAALALLAGAFRTTARALWSQSFSGQITGILDQILLVLLIVELLYTVQVSFREHELLVEPFLVIALIAVVRRILVITAELPKLSESGTVVFRQAMMELGLLSGMIVVLVGSVVLFQHQSRQRTA